MFGWSSVAAPGYERLSRALVLGAVCSACCGCGSVVHQFPDEPPLWHDDDRHPFAPKPEESYSGLAWDGADQLVFRPITRFFAVDPAGEAANVNAWDEVPDSSWFTNRIGAFAMSAEQVADGPCQAPPPNPDERWWVTAAKPNGANPGFIIETESGQNYLLKFDGVVQGPRATSADVLGALLYHAAGYFVPCNRIVFFDAKILEIAPRATSENRDGDDIPLERDHVERVLRSGVRLADGRYRALASLFVEGKPLGPWQYQGTRSDDPNDVVEHQERRELRGMRLLAAWIHHFDSREQNTLASWIETQPGHGYVRHYVIDFGDSLGSIWDPPSLGRRIGHSNYFDFHDVPLDWLTLGLRERPWDRARFGASGPVFGYFDGERFDPEAWQPGYPNPAFGRMSDRDAAWMARIIARFSDEHVAAAVSQARLSKRLEALLANLLIERRDKILKAYLERLSPLTRPRVLAASSSLTRQPVRELAQQLCLDDLALASHLLEYSQRRYWSLGWDGQGRRVDLGVIEAQGSRVCQPLPPGVSYLMVDLRTGAAGRPEYRVLRVHLRWRTSGYRVVGLERLSRDRPPGD